MHTPLDSKSPDRAASSGVEDDAVLRQSCAELERRLRSGEPARAEEFLTLYHSLADDPEQALDLIFTEYVTRRELNESPLPGEYFDRFPQLRAQLQHQFQLDELLDAATPEESRAAGRFRIVQLLARGGIGEVMRAVDTELNREVAVKQLQPALVDNDEICARFLREAEITGKLEHPGIVPVYGLGCDAEGRPFYAMRLVRGQSLQDAATDFHAVAPDRGRFISVAFQKLLRRFLHVCETVAYAHSRGIIHRDLKPANILLGPFGETLVVDWGLARASGGSSESRAENETAAAGNGEPPQAAPPDSLSTPVARWSSQLTHAIGEVMGTPAFMSPEQAAGDSHRIGPASDVYSLGATLYLLLTGRAPFSGSQVDETLRRVSSGSFERPRERSRAIPRPLEAICLKAMATSPQQRYASPRDLASDLEHWLADEPVTAAPEPFSARFARWGRRHRTHVVAGMLALLVVTLISLVAAIRINNERLRADRERVEANRRNARLAFDRGLALIAEFEHGAAMLWFAKALEHAPPEDAAMRRVILTNLNATQHHLLRRKLAFSHEDRLGPSPFSPDGKRLLITRGSTPAIVWDADLGTALSQHPMTSGRVVAAGFAADGTALVAVHQSATLAFHRLPPAPQDEADSPPAIEHAQPISRAALQRGARLIATATSSNQSSKTRIWRLSDGELLADLDYRSEVAQIVFRPRADAVAITYGNGVVQLWLVEEKRLAREFRAAGATIDCVAFTPDGGRLLAGDSAGSVSCWDVESGRRLFDVGRHSGGVTAVDCASDGQTVAAAWDTGTVRIWDLRSRRPASELLRLDRFTRRLAFRPDARQLLIAADQTELVLWDLPDPARAAAPLNQRRVISVAFSQDGKHAATGSGGKTARIRDGKTGRSLSRALPHAGAVRAVAFRPDGAVLVTAGSNGTAHLWKIPGGDLHGQPLEHRPNPRSIVEVNSATFSPDGRLIATGDSRGVVRLWDGQTGELIRQVADRPGTATCVLFSPSGEQIAAAFSAPESGVLLWDVAGGDARWKASHAEAVRTIAFSPDGRLVLSGSNDDTARFWDAVTGQPLGRELVHNGEVWVGQFGPSGQMAVTGGYDATIRFWSVPGGEPIGEPMRHEGVVMAAAFTADGQRLLTGGSDGSARLWDVATCLPLSPPIMHADQVRAVGINPLGGTALTGRDWQLPAPLPDDPPLIDVWVKLATGRGFSSGENVEWLPPAALAELAQDFETRTGKPWQQWAP